MREKLLELKQNIVSWWDSLDAPVASPTPVRVRTAVTSTVTKPVLSTTVPMTMASPQEYRRLFTQSMVFFGISGVVWLLFLFVLMPLMIRFAGNLNNLSFEAQDDKMPPRVPSFSVPQTATNSARIKIAGYGEAQSTVVLVRNGQQEEKVVADDEGEFSVEFNLEEGKNSIAFFAIDQANNESTLSQVTEVTYDKDIPELAWDEPSDQKVVTNLREREIKVSGQTQEQSRIFLNDKLVFGDSSGKFSDTFYLNDGENVLTLKVVDPAGNEIEEKRTVFFRP